LKIAFVGNASSVHTVKFVNALCEKGHDVTLFTLSADGAGGGPLSSAARLRRLKGGSSLAYYLAAPELGRALKKGSFDVVNAHYASGYGTLARLAQASPLVLNVWGSDVYDFPFQSSFKRRLLVKNLLFADKIASTSHAMKRHVLSLLGEGYKKEIAVVPFGVDLKTFRPRSPDPGPPPRGAAVNIGVVKTLKPSYGTHVLIRAFKALADRLGPAVPLRLSVYGDGPQLPELQVLCAELGVSDRAVFGGFVENSKLPAILDTFDIFAAASLVNESFGVALVEAMSNGLPVVATDADGFREVVDDNVTGLIVPRGDPGAMAGALLTLALDKQLRGEMGARGRRKVEELYDLGRNTDALIGCYMEAMAGRG
jgi:glycosyltransferase involved in cell wall biosynthesis